MKKLLFLALCAINVKPQEPKPLLTAGEEDFQKKKEALLTAEISTIEKVIISSSKEQTKLKENLQSILKTGPKELILHTDTLFGPQKLKENFFQEVEEQIIMQKENALFNQEEVEEANKKLDFLKTNREKIINIKLQLDREHDIYSLAHEKKTALLIELKTIIQKFNVSPEEILKKHRNIKNGNVIALLQEIGNDEKLKANANEVLGGVLTLMQKNKLSLNR